MNWTEIPGWFQWRGGQEEAVRHFASGARFVEVGLYLGRSLCSLGDVIRTSGKAIRVIGVDTCLGSGIEGPRGRDYHAGAVTAGGGTLAGPLHRHVVECGCADLVTLVIADSIVAASLVADRSLDWVHLDARHDRASLEADIVAWQPKVKNGGWLSGDDYDAVKWPDVVSTVRDLAPAAAAWSAGQWRWIL